MSLPTISVIMPAYNAERYIGQALNSVYAQDYEQTRLDVIVVDDGSTDGTVDIIGRYEERLRCIRQPNRGPAAARNTALAAARGDFVAFLDADDLWHPRKLSLQMSAFKAIPDLELSICHVRNVWTGHPNEAESQILRRYKAVLNAGIIMQSVLIPRRIMNEIGFFDPSFRFGEDTDWFVRAHQSRRRTSLTSMVLGYRRVHLNNMTVDFPPLARETMFKVIQAAARRNRGQAAQSKNVAGDPADPAEAHTNMRQRNQRGL